MPAKSKDQFKFIMTMRKKYGSKKNAPKDMKWVFDKEWTDVNYEDLPDKIEESTSLFDKFVEWYNESK